MHTHCRVTDEDPRDLDSNAHSVMEVHWGSGTGKTKHLPYFESHIDSDLMAYNTNMNDCIFYKASLL